jgi:hypothetical protein
LASCAAFSQDANRLGPGVLRRRGAFEFVIVQGIDGSSGWRRAKRFQNHVSVALRLAYEFAAFRPTTLRFGGVGVNVIGIIDRSRRAAGTWFNQAYLRLFWGILIYLFLVSLAFAVNYPGRLNPDSIDQLTQAIHPELLSDWHEPWTIVFWRPFSPLLGEPASALLSQCLVLFVYPAVLITRAITDRECSAWVWIFLGIFTVSLIEISGQIVKDALLLGFILCFLAVLDREDVPRSRWKTLLALLPVIAASLIRPVNAFLFGAASAFALLTYRVRWRIAVSALLLVLAVCACQVPVVRFLDETDFKASHGNIESALMIFDVAGISANLRSDLFAEIPGWPTQALPRPWDCYNPYYWDAFKWGKCNQYFDLFNARVSNRYGFWIDAILSHPSAYLLHRARYLYRDFRSPAPVATFRVPEAVNTESAEAQMFGASTHGIDMRGQFQLWRPTAVSRIVEWFAALVFSRPAGLVQIAACFVAVLFGIGKGRGAIDKAMLMAGGIGVANILLMAALGVSALGRYLLPSYVCGFLILMKAASLRARVNGAARFVSQGHPARTPPPR